ncbi:MAG: lytic transglycosylase domain-containing protein [Pseudolabrys sp.]
MYFSGENIFIILLVGLIVGLLPSTVVHRTRIGLISDIAVSIVGVFVGGWLMLVSHHTIPVTIDLPPSKPPENIAADLAPGYEPVVLPLAPLRPLLKPTIYRSREEICDALAEAARSNDLPAHFFMRLLYQESSFRPSAISSAGALGIAQFMEETATDRGLDNPFDPVQAIPASARLLRDLYQKFGNLGLAAAAYNAGPRRIADWLTNKGPLPQETQDYVKAITGWPVATWTFVQAGSPAVKLPRPAPCQEIAGLLAWNGPDQIPLPPLNPRVQALADHVTVAQQSTGPRTKTDHVNRQAAKRGQAAKTHDVAGN